MKQFELDVVIIDTSVPPQAEPPRNHNDLNLSIAIFETLQPQKMVLTHLGHQMDDWLLDNALPFEKIEVARDEQVIALKT